MSGVPIGGFVSPVVQPFDKPPLFESNKVITRIRPFAGCYLSFPFLRQFRKETSRFGVEIPLSRPRNMLAALKNIAYLTTRHTFFIKLLIFTYNLF